MAKAKNQDVLSEIASELVVFQHEDKNRADRYFSNDPRWNDSRIRDRWMELYSDEAIGADDEADEDGDDPEEVDLPYDQWKNEDLRAELVTRGLSVDGTKAQMAARLTEDDEKQV